MASGARLQSRSDSRDNIYVQLKDSDGMRALFSTAFNDISNIFSDIFVLFL